LSGKPAGFVGDSGLSVRIVYTTAGSTWNWVQYFPNDPENRYGVAITALQADKAPIDDASLTGLTLAESIGVETSIGFSDADQSHAVFLQAPSVVPANVTFFLPSADGTNGQLLATNGSGQLAWETPDPGVLLIDGGNFDNGSSTINLSQTFDGGEF
jgi:hypothetical protein